MGAARTIALAGQDGGFVKEPGRIRVPIEGVLQAPFPFRRGGLRRGGVGLFGPLDEERTGVAGTGRRRRRRVSRQQYRQNIGPRLVRRDFIFSVAVAVVLRIVVVQPNIDFVFVRHINVSKIDGFRIGVFMYRRYRRVNALCRCTLRSIHRGKQRSGIRSRALVVCV